MIATDALRREALASLASFEADRVAKLCQRRKSETAEGKLS